MLDMLFSSENVASYVTELPSYCVVYCTTKTIKYCSGLEIRSRIRQKSKDEIRYLSEIIQYMEVFTVQISVSVKK